MSRMNWSSKIRNLILAAAFLSGMLVFETNPAYTQEPATPQIPYLPIPVAHLQAQDITEPESITCPEDPPMGERAKLLDDQEVGAVYTYKQSPLLNYHSLDKPRDKWNFVDIDSQSCRGGACKSITSPSITMADLFGNDQAMAVMAFRDSEKRVALGIPTEDGIAETWYSDLTNAQGIKVDWIGIAAGNLDGADTGDNSDEVVVAFRDNSKALNVMIPAVIDAPNRLSAYYRDDSSNGRGNVKYVSLATGDLDGDGYDNEIITVFRDGKNNLQTMIFRKQSGSQQLKKLWSRSWTEYYRFGVETSNFNAWSKTVFHPIDVTTGDIDGDLQDEVILAFEDSNNNKSCGFYAVFGHVQILVLDYVGDGSVQWSSDDINDEVWTESDPSDACPEPSKVDASLGPQSISIAAADLDGDGVDEIALAYTFGTIFTGWSHSLARLWTYDYVDVSDPEYDVCLNDNGDLVPCLQPRDKLMLWDQKSGKARHIAMDAGDINRDGFAEIVVAYLTWDDNSLWAFKFDAKDKITGKGKHNLSQSTRLNVAEFDLKLADMDGDAVYGTYANNHYLKWSSYVESVVHSPPYWPGDNDYDTEAAFGQSVGHGGGSGETSETSMGGSVTVKAQFEDVGPSFTVGWEKSCAVENQDVIIEVEGTTFKTTPPCIQPEKYYMDAVGYSMCPHCCYEYIENANNTTVTICLPERPCSKAQAGLDAWYKDIPNAEPPEGVGDNWVPVGMNFARGKPSQQSSTVYGGAAALAVDGNTDGVFSHDSVTYTRKDLNAWWQTDMQIIPAVHAVQLWNRTDADTERLSDFYVFLSEVPFTSNDPDVLRQDPDVWHYYHTGPADRLTTVAWSDFRNHQDETPEHSRELTGRYLRVQLTDKETLSLAEVQVWGVPSQVDQWPVSAPSSTDTVSFTVDLPGGGSQLVDGKFILKRNSTLHVSDQGSPDFDNSTEEEWEQMSETSTEVDAKVGFSIKVAEADFTTGSKHVRSRIMTWSKETEFSGQAGMIEDNPHYDYAPYMWMQRAKSSSGLEQAFLILDYWVPYIQSTSSATTAAVGAPAEPLVDIAPQAPLIDSSTHPSSDAWYDTNTVSFSWMQPPGDPAVITGYHWYLDRNPDTIPPTYKSELFTSYTYQNLGDGIWYLHVRAKGEGDMWSETAHRIIKIDTHPPEVELVKDPTLPSGHSGWYKTPLVVTANADDGPGSGVANIQVSQYKILWHPYTGDILFDTDTPQRNLWARAIDHLGHVSEPVSTTFKIDLTPPDSKVQRDSMLGLLFARVLNDDMGNEHPILAGAVWDLLSKPAGMDLEINAFDWTSAIQDLSDFWFDLPDWIVDKPFWIYDGFSEISRGNLKLSGRSQDKAGNLEDIYDLVGELVWFPQASPDLSDSSLTANLTTARPGETVEFVAALRNHGNQEALVKLTHQLPVGLTPMFDQLPDGVGYEPTSRTLTWPERLIWPGEWHRVHYKAVVDAGLGPTELVSQASVFAFWPNTAGLPTPDRKRFEERQQNVGFSTTVIVEPGLAGETDNQAPWVFLNVINKLTTEPQSELSIQSSPDAHWMYLCEWILDGYTGEWQVAQDSGWLPYNEIYPWTLSPGAGVKYIGVWAADESGNMSTLDEHSLDFTNLHPGTSQLADGQRHQYRFDLEPGSQAVFNLEASQGDPDLYAWNPYHALLPNYAAEEDMPVDELSFYPKLKGIHLFEVLGRGESAYRLLSSSTGAPAGPESPMDAEAVSLRPQYPLTVSNPLTSAIREIPDPPGDLRIHFPLIYKQ